MATAREMIVADGVEALSLRGLARRLGVTAPALYSHVDNKEALIRAVAEIEIGRLAQDFDMTIGATDILWQDTAASYSTEFYGALASGLSLRAAHDRAMLNLGIMEKPGVQAIRAYHCPTGDQGDWVPFPR